MNFDELTLEQIEARMAEIRSIVDSKDETADYEALTAEVDKLEERKAFLIEEERKADIIAVTAGAGEETKLEIPVEEKKMDLKELRSSKEYMDAYAEYLKTEDKKEVRALLTDMVQDGVVPVPTFIEDEIKTSWEKSDLLSLVKKTYIKGILKVPFELSADPAVIHTEGAKAPNEEVLALGIVEIKPAMIKKFIRISDEVFAMKGEAFLRYIYDEITERIAELAEKTIIDLIENAPDTADATSVSVSTVAADVITLGTVAEALSKLSAAAKNPVIVLNRSTWAAFKAVQAAGNYGYDPFEGLNVIYSHDLTAYNSAEAGETYAVVGDFSGIQANFPEGEDIVLKFDDITYAPEDLIQILGRQYVGFGIVNDKFFTKIAKEAES